MLRKAFLPVPGRGWECSWAALGSVRRRSNPGGEQWHSVNASSIPFSISKLSCVKSLTQTPARQGRVKSVSMGEMKRADWIPEQTEQLLSFTGAVDFSVLFDIENVKRSAGFNDEASSRLNLCTNQ